VKKYPVYEMWKDQILADIGVDPDKPTISVKKNVRNHSYHQFIGLWRRSGFTEVSCAFFIFVGEELTVFGFVRGK